MYFVTNNLCFLFLMVQEYCPSVCSAPQGWHRDRDVEEYSQWNGSKQWRWSRKWTWRRTEHEVLQWYHSVSIRALKLTLQSRWSLGSLLYFVQLAWNVGMIWSMTDWIHLWSTHHSKNKILGKYVTMCVATN